ncbi:hypothetical protein BJX63DRAFT_416682 [Aspergillus granulosus]|uniref:Chromo domain-containing protein n=1 Tax=Aspergillus granulosus TaxID=176169 RepID=A0ABR4GS79_9EURO
MRKMFYLLNRKSHLPEEWNIPLSVAECLFGERPPGIIKAPYEDDDNASAVLYISSSKEELEIDETEGIDALEAKIQKDKTRGSAKITLKSNKVQDIIGVGWKVEDNNNASANALALIRPVKDATYPYIQVLVKWKDQNVSLERRAFVRRITHGNGLNSDWLIYLKAKELENAYWGYNVEGSSDKESDTSDVSLADESLDRQTSRKKTCLTESNATSDSDLDLDTSESRYEQKKRRSRRLRHKKTKSKDDYDTDAEIRDLQEKLGRIKLKKAGKKAGKT